MTINENVTRNTVLSEIDFTDKRIKSALVLDVETTLGKGNETLIFDIGWTVSHVTKQEMVMHRSFIVQEVFLDMQQMKRAHYFKKYPEYVLGIIGGTIDVVNWATVKATLESDIKAFNVNRIMAYNAGFDKGAISKTEQYLNEFSTYELDMSCLMVATVESLLATKDYVLTAYLNKWFTKGGNILTNAESAYRYITKELDFVEAHTGLEDSIIETKILWKVASTNSKKVWEIGSRSWRDVDVIKQELSLEIERTPTVRKPKEWVKVSTCKSEVIELPNRTVEIIVTETENAIVENEVVKVKANKENKNQMKLDI